MELSNVSSALSSYGTSATQEGSTARTQQNGSTQKSSMDLSGVKKSEQGMQTPSESTKVTLSKAAVEKAAAEDQAQKAQQEQQAQQARQDSPPAYSQTSAAAYRGVASI